MSRLYNFFNLRWTDGYSHVSDAPADMIVDIEALLAQQSVQGALVKTRRARAGGYRDASLGILKIDVDVGGRRCSFSQVLVLAEGYDSLSEDRWALIVRDRYGADLETKIRELYERLSRLEKADGRHELECLEVHAAEVADLVPTPNDVLSRDAERAHVTTRVSSTVRYRALKSRLPAWLAVVAVMISAVAGFASARYVQPRSVFDRYAELPRDREIESHANQNNDSVAAILAECKANLGQCKADFSTLQHTSTVSAPCPKQVKLQCPETGNRPIARQSRETSFAADPTIAASGRSEGDRKPSETSRDACGDQARELEEAKSALNDLKAKEKKWNEKGCNDATENRDIIQTRLRRLCVKYNNSPPECRP